MEWWQGKTTVNHILTPIGSVNHAQGGYRHDSIDDNVERDDIGRLSVFLPKRSKSNSLGQLGICFTYYEMNKCILFEK